MEKAIELAELHIEKFDLEKKHYELICSSDEKINIVGQGIVLIDDKQNMQGKAVIKFGKTENCKVIIGKNFKGSVAIDFHGNNSIVYIGDNCILGSVAIRSIAKQQQCTFIGNGVTATGKCLFYSGDGAGGGGLAKSGLVVGDDCMFAWDITVRNTDAHPIFNRRTHQQLNEPNIGIVCIEPHVWIGQNVCILKDVTIGACSIIGLGSVVTKDVPRFSRASGIPAMFKTDSDVFWSRSSNASCKKRALYFTERYSKLT